MSLRADERTEQFERGYQAALREAAEQIKAELDMPPGARVFGSELIDKVLAVVERLRG